MRPTLKFFALTFLLSWTAWIAAAALRRGAATPSVGLQAAAGALYFLGVFAPALVALAVTAQAEGRAAARALLQRTVQGAAGARWYVFAIVYMAAVKLAAALALRVATGAWPAFGRESVWLMAAAMLISTPVQSGEEIGWRGFALPRLSAPLGLAGASVALGVVWACWHLPFFVVAGTDKSGQSFPVYLLTVIALSVAMAWLYWKTNGSLLATMLMHAAINNTMDVVPSAGSAATGVLSLGASPVAWVSLAILWSCASYFLIRMRGVRLPLGSQDAGRPRAREGAHPGAA